MKNILIVIDSLGKGGAEKALLNFIKFLDENPNYSIDLLIVYKNNNLNHYLSKLPQGVNLLKGVYYPQNKIFRKIFHTAIRFLNDSSLYRLFIKNNKKYDFEVSFLEGLSSRVVAGSPQQSKKYLWVHCDTINFPWYSLYFKNRKLEQKTFSAFDKVITVSSILKESIVKKYKIENVKVIYNLIDEERILNLSEEKFDYKKPYICSIGRLHPIKGFDRLILGYHFLKDKYGYLPYNVVIIGEGDELINLQNLIKEYNLSEDIIILPFTENPYKYIKNSLALMSTSLSEGLPMVFLESILLNKFIITTDHSGAREIVCKDNGMIFDNTEVGIVEAFDFIYKNVNELKKHSNSNCSNHIQSINKIINLFE